MSEPLNMWDKRFATEEYLFGKEANAFLADIAPTLTMGQTLCIAEGEGRNAVYLAEIGHRVSAWDYARAGLEKAENLARERGVELETKLVDLEEAEWAPASWDNIVCIFGHFPKDLRLQVLQGVKEAVKPGGMFVTEVYSIHQPAYKSGGPQELDLLYQPEDFLEVFKDWKIIHLFMGEVERYEGARHQGLSHVIQFLGQKNKE